MNRWLRFTYSRLLRLYPVSFKTLFAEEMLEVFDLALSHARLQGPFALLYLGLKELAELPFNLIREHISDYTQRLQNWSQQQRNIHYARWITRLALLCLSIFFLIVDGAPNNTEDLLISTSISILLVSGLLAWRWERAGGIVLTTSAITLAIIGAVGFTAIFSDIVLSVLIILGAFLFVMPYLLIGVMFIAIGQKSQKVMQAT